MSMLQARLAQLVPALRDTVKKLTKGSGAVKIADCTIEQAFGGMRGVKALVCDTSEVPPDKGLIIRGIPVAQLTGQLPEETLWLLLTGEQPDAGQLADLQADLRARARVPEYVWAVLGAMPADSHPMAMLSTAILVMEKESVFRQRYDAGMKKDEYWIATLEDALRIIAVLPEIAAGIYRMRFGKGPRISSHPGLDWAADYGAMLGIADPTGNFARLMRLYMVLHSDHESGNVSAMTTATVNSALSDLYYSLSAGLNGLAGPLHGLANQECLAWVLDTNTKFGGPPTREQIKTYAQQTLAAGRVIPGYGHAVLRITDPRFDALLAFGEQYMADDPVFQTVSNVFETVPDILKTIQKIKDPWPNVDAGSGALLYHYGLTEFAYYSVLFSVSRALGVCSQAVMARAMGLPITRPKSVTSRWLEGEAARAAAAKG
jgi:citrate synthase